MLVSGGNEKKEKTLHPFEEAVNKQVRAKDGKLKVTDMMCESMENLHSQLHSELARLPSR